MKIPTGIFVKSTLLFSSFMILLCAFLIIALVVPSAYAQNSRTVLPITVAPLNSSGSLTPNTSYSYNFVFSSSASCSPLLNLSASITTNARGIGYSELNISNLSTTPSYVCEYIGGSFRKAHPVFSTMFESQTKDSDILSFGYNHTSSLDSYFVRNSSIPTCNATQKLTSSGNGVFSCSDDLQGSLGSNGTVTSVYSGSFMNAVTINTTGTLGVNASALVANIGNWSADKSSYASLSYVGSLGNFTAGNASLWTNASNQQLQINSLNSLFLENTSLWSNATNQQAQIQGLLSSNGTINSRLSSLVNLSISQVSSNIGNWSADKSSYNTTSQLSSLFAPIGSAGDNASFNQSLTDSLYYAKSNPYGFVNSTSLGYNKSAWDAAYSWGNHASAGYSTLILSQVSSNLGNWSADKSSYASVAYVVSIGNFTAGNASLWTNASNQQLQINSLNVLFSENTSLWSNASAQAAAIAGKAGTGSATCAAGQVMQNVSTTTSGVTGQCVAAPGGATAGGVAGNLQYNNGTGIGGATYASVLNGYLFINATSEPAFSNTSGITIYSEDRGNENTLAYKGRAGYEKFVMPHSGYEDIAWYQPAHTAAGTTAPICVGCTVVAPVGTVANPAITGLNLKSTMIWSQLTSALGLLEFKGAGLNWMRGNDSIPIQNGGFKFVYRFNYVSMANNASSCVGLFPSVAAMSNISNCYLGATFGVNSIFVGQNQSQTTLGIWSNDASGGPTRKMDCGSDYPAGNNTGISTAVYEATIFARPADGGINSTDVSVYVIRLDNTSISPCTTVISSDIPAQGVPLGWHIWSWSGPATLSTGNVMSMNKVWMSRDN